jgi:hypothetical protein
MLSKAVATEFKLDPITVIVVPPLPVYCIYQVHKVLSALPFGELIREKLRNYRIGSVSKLPSQNSMRGICCCDKERERPRSVDCRRQEDVGFVSSTAKKHHTENCAPCFRTLPT